MQTLTYCFYRRLFPESGYRIFSNIIFRIFFKCVIFTEFSSSFWSLQNNIVFLAFIAAIDWYEEGFQIKARPFLSISFAQKLLILWNRARDTADVGFSCAGHLTKEVPFCSTNFQWSNVKRLQASKLFRTNSFRSICDAFHATFHRYSKRKVAAWFCKLNRFLVKRNDENELLYYTKVYIRTVPVFR